ncbi:GPP34 family phosphoprotein [Dactylosporangium sp. AC04546]|uniref:GOLPH3/VPS74 family protein n=1 Tax=Dactylosporangium sp. AC04546 TaxID=2862460 RepID=UPI001EDD893A|nr:GPP34 family phosphoprotein [Dactylosporangium sp. AC04546]WVK83691.1 GPP34 family phosphoprotein [Dactylosporangium sp. AC04546]
MLLADDFFLIAHDDRDGKSRLSQRAVELGLAGALLGELVLEQRIFCEGDRLRVISREPPSDPLAHTNLATMVAETQHREIRTWLLFLGQTAVDAVGQRMARHGLVEQTTVRRLLRSSTRWVATDINLPTGRVVRLRRLLTGSEPMRVADATLAGLAEATGLTGHVLWDTDQSSFRRLQHVITTLPPPLRDLILQVESAIGEAVLSQRG